MDGETEQEDAQSGVDGAQSLVVSVPDMQHAPMPIRRTITYDQLLDETEQVPRQPLVLASTKATRSCGQTQNEDDRAEDLALCEKSIQQTAVSPTPVEQEPASHTELDETDDWAETFKLYNRNLGCLL